MLLAGNDTVAEVYALCHLVHYLIWHTRAIIVLRKARATCSVRMHDNTGTVKKSFGMSSVYMI